VPASPRRPLAAADRRRLLAAARAARGRAYAPYSRFRVGAALLAEDGRVFAGCNVENTSSASTLCAEQAAVARAVAEGARRFRAILVAGSGPAPVPPCGRCRQVLAEFRGDLPVLMADRRGRIESASMADLLPRPFRR
jgi:cytidine deaminase